VLVTIILSLAYSLAARIATVGMRIAVRLPAGNLGRTRIAITILVRRTVSLTTSNPG